MNNTPDEFKKFSSIMVGVSENFGGNISKEQLKTRFKLLKEFSIEQVTKGAIHLLKNRRETFPAVPTIKEFIDAIRLIESPTVSVKAEIEVDKVLDTLKEWGRDAEALFYDEITTYLMTHRWTFRQLDMMTIRDPGFVFFRKEFVKAYMDLENDKAVGRNILPELSGPESEEIKKIINGAVKRLPA